jgi:hypothetical protein
MRIVVRPISILKSRLFRGHESGRTETPLDAHRLLGMPGDNCVLASAIDGVLGTEVDTRKSYIMAAEGVVNDRFCGFEAPGGD